MNNHAKRLCKTLESIDFRRDYDAEKKTNARRVYRHANDMAQAIKVFDSMNDNSITMATRLANKIADTGWSGPRQPQTIRERANIIRRKGKTTRQRETEARQERADRADAEYESQQQTVAVDRHYREITDLMKQGFGH